MSNLQPGRELDALVAEKIFGCVVRDEPDEPWTTEGPHCGCEHRVHEELETDPEFTAPVPSGLRRYSTDIAAAWEVVQVLNDRWNVTIHSPEAGEAEVEVVLNGCVGVNPRLEARAETVPHAICLAALEAQSQ